MESPLQDILKWRELETEQGIINDQNFLTRTAMQSPFGAFELVPLIDIELGDMSRQKKLDNLKK